MREPCPHNCGHKPLKFEVACFAAALAGIMSKIKVLLTCLLFTFSTLISTKSILPHTQIKLLSRSIFFFLFLSYPSSGQSEYSVVLTSTDSQKLTISYHIHHDQDIIYIYMCVCVCVCVYIYIYIYIYYINLTVLANSRSLPPVADSKHGPSFHYPLCLWHMYSFP